MMKQIGYVGIVNDKPYYENATDDYVKLGGKSFQSVEVYRSRREAKKRFQKVVRVFILTQRDGTL
jgi:hypothetical protein